MQAISPEYDYAYGSDFAEDLDEELEQDFASDIEAEWDLELESDVETEEFLGALANWARRTVRRLRTPGTPERKWAIGIGKGLMTGGGGLIGLGLGGPPGGVIGSALGGAAAHGLYPSEEDWEADDAESTIAEMERLGYLASMAESDEDAEAFIGALVPLAAKLIPRAASVIRTVAPNIIRNVSKVARTLRRSRATRPLVRTLPTIVRNTTRHLTRQARRGLAPTPKQAARTVMRQSARVIRSPQRTASAIARCNALNRRLLHVNRILQGRILAARRRGIRV